MYDDIAEETGYADRTLRLVKETAEKIESGRRLPELSFSHHVEVASRCRDCRSATEYYIRNCG